MARVWWRRLVLRGFGCYREEKTLTLGEGLNVYVAANEEGKSTLVMGLVAVLYGLPGSSDPGVFGKARYQNWDGPREFSGELEFRVDNRDYRLQRDFASDRVVLARWEEGAWRELVGGEHRARARRPNISYTEALRKLIGLETPALFTATFCLTQPLPRGDSLEEEVLRLLSGAARGYRAALGNLENSLKELTRYTRELGVTAGNLRADRRLELLKAEISSLEENIDRARRSLDAFPAIQEELLEKQKQRTELAARLKEKEAALRAWGEWRALRLRYQGLVNEQSRYEEALERARELVKREEELRQEIAATYPEMQHLPPEAGAALKRLAELAEKVEAREEERQRLTTALAEHRREIEALEVRLRQEFAAVDGRPGLVQQHRELLVRLQEKEELAARLHRARQAADRAREQLPELGPWEKLGSRPTVLLPERQRLARTILAEWQEFQNMLRQVEALEAELAGDPGWFERASPRAREACRDYASKKERLARQREKAEAALEQARSRLADLERAREEWRQEFGVLAALGEEAAHAVEEKLALLQAKRELAARAAAAGASGGRPFWRRPWVWLAAALAAILAFAFWPLALAAVLATVLGWWHARRRHRREARQALMALQEEMGAQERALAALEQRYPFLVDWDERELIRAQERWALCCAQEQALAARAATLPGAEEVAGLERALAEAKREEEEFAALTAEAERLFPDVAQAYARWEALRQQCGEMRERLRAWAQREFGREPAEVGTCPLAAAGERWQELASLAAVARVSCRTVGELVDWLAGLDPAWWQQMFAAAEAWEEASAALARAREEEEALLGKTPTAEGSLARLARVIDSLRQAVAPFDEQTDTAVLEALVRDCQELRTRLEGLRTLIQDEEGRLERLGGELENWRRAQEETAAFVGPLLAASGGQVEAARQRWEEFRGKQAAVELAAQNLRSLLQGQGVSSLEELRVRAADAAHQAAQVLSRWQEVVAAHPALPEPSLQEDPEGAYQSLRREVEQLAAQAEELGRDIETLRGKQAELAGSAPLNLPASEERLAALREEQRRVELEVEALALAHRELRLAAEEFQAGHRQRLAQRATEHFAFLSGVGGRRLEIAEDFHLYLTLPGGQVVEVTQLSQGAQDQLYLALRLAVADLLSGELVLPFIFDDPFLNFDEQRLEFARRTIRRLSSERQVLLLSHRREFLSWQ